LIPVNGAKYLDDATAKGKPPKFLQEELRDRLAAGPANFRLLLQLPNTTDQTNDGSIVWPDDRIVTITSVVADSAAAERELAFHPTHLIDGIELSDDPLPALRSLVYKYSVAGRRTK